MSVRLYIGNLPKELERQELEAVFSDFDDSVSTKVITDRKTGKCRGFGFVTVKNDEQADQLIEKYNGYVLKESALKIEKALPRSKGKEDEAPVASTSGSPSSNARRKGPSNNNNKSRKSGGGSFTDSESVQPDPRWAQELEKLKQMLTTQTANS